MRLPPKPPSWTSEGLEAALRGMLRPEMRDYVTAANAEYFHWEKLRHRPLPQGLTAEQAWQMVKLSRMGQRHFLHLRDERGTPFSYWVPDRGLAILHEVDRWGGSTWAVDPKVPSFLGPMRDRVVIRSLMEEAIATSQLEGAATTYKVAKEMLRTNRKPRDRSEQMIVNSYQTIQLLRERLDRPLSTDLLHEIQERMTHDTLDDPSAAGRFRTPAENVSVVDVRDQEVVFTPPSAGALPERLEQMYAFANSPSEEPFIHPLVKAAILHFWLAFEHPYVDGNGRTARALFYWFMLKSGYWLFEFLTISRIIQTAPLQYHRSFLYSEQDDNDLTYSLMFQLRATQRALVDLHEYLKEKQAEQQALALALRNFSDLNHRQRAVMERALHDPGQVFTFQSHRNSHDITLVTARQDLLDLARRGLLTEAALKGRQRAFVAAEDLSQRLASPEGVFSKRRKRSKKKGQAGGN